MSTNNDTPRSPASSLGSHPSPAEPTPQASSFPRPHTLPPPPPCPTLVTPTGPSKTGMHNLTPSLEPTSELTMVLAAIDNMKSSLSVEIIKVNEWVDALILNPPDLVPSSQPYEDFGDFSLPTTADHQQFNRSHTIEVDNTHYTTVEEESHIEGLYFDLAKILYTSGRCTAFSEEDHCHFAKLLTCILAELGWPLMPASFSPDQLDHVARCWNACCSEEEAAMKHFQDLDLFDDLFSTTHPHTADDLLQFSSDIDRYCAHFKKGHPIPDPEHIFLKDFISKPCSIAPENPKPCVHFSEPPIATLNPPQDPTLQPLSEVPIPDPADFLPLLGKPFGDTWLTVTKRGKKKKAPSPPPQAAPVPAPPTSMAPPSGQPSFAAAATTIRDSVSTPQAAPNAKARPIKPQVPNALRSTQYSIILNHSHADICEMLGIDAGRIFRNIRADLECVNAPLTLLAGHWSSVTINKNFILTFAGLQKWDDIAKYDAIFFQPFGPDCRGAPTAGYHSALLCRVPLVRDSVGRLPSPQDLDKEIGHNTAFKGVLSLAPPRWLYNLDHID
jgi:hypothetical protein